MARIDDIHDLPSKLADERERLTDAVKEGEVAKADREALIEFDQHRDVEDGVRNATRYADQRQLRVAATESDTSLTDLEDAQAVTGLLHTIKYRRGQGNPLSPQTMHKYRCSLRNLFEFLDRDWWDDIDGALSQSRTERSVDGDDMYATDEVEALIGEARSVRDEALVEMLADTGARISLLGTLRVKDLTLDSNRPTFTPHVGADGLKDVPNKPYPLIDSPAVLRRYLNRHHPRSDEPEAPLFHKHPEYYDPEDSADDGALGYQGIYSMLQSAARRAGIDKPANPHNFRHTAITRMMADDAFTKDDIRHRVGWAKDTQMWERYDHLDAETRNSNLFVRTGLADPDEESGPSRAPCGNCGTMTQTDRRYCGQCGAAVTEEARETVEETQGDVSKDRVRADDPVDRLLYQKLGEKLDMEPSVVERRLEGEGDHDDLPSSSSSSSS